MKHIKLIFTILLFLGFTATGFAQSDKMKDKATEKVEKVNASIVKGDKGQALTDEQKTKIYVLQLEAQVNIKKIKKAESDKEKQKELIKAEHKRVGKYISQSILTKAQKQSRKKGRIKN